MPTTRHTSAYGKVEGPSTQFPFLGITLDTVRMEAHFPVDKNDENQSNK